MTAFRVGLIGISIPETSSQIGWILCSGISWISIPESVRGRLCFPDSGLGARVFFHGPFYPTSIHSSATLSLNSSEILEQRNCPMHVAYLSATLASLDVDNTLYVLAIKYFSSQM